ncbi:MAG: diapophytoene dehydrogenase [Bacteroidetes bacterium]|nr:MAG: diapophytoene dehydrogenase [Bacteroidota bacterium]
MANFELIMPKLGESIEEATITNWFVKVGDKIEEEDVLLEIATDKVDSEIPSPVDGIVKEIRFKQDDLVPVGTVIAVIGTGTEEEASPDAEASAENEVSQETAPEPPPKKEKIEADGDRFYSPLVKRIALENGLTADELASIRGSGREGRVRKNDILSYLESRGAKIVSGSEAESASDRPKQENQTVVQQNEGEELIEMSRMRKLIAGHMLQSKQISAHVSNMLEVDVSSVVEWRNRVKNDFLEKEGVKLTYLPVFLQATVLALKDFPQINASVRDEHIVLKKSINLGIAVSLPDNNLIVPNIKNADHLNLVGMAKSLNDLAGRARSNQLKPDEISGGTFTVTNFGSFNNDIGTPIINQPEVAILAVGAIRKKPAVVETEAGDAIVIRQQMWLSLTYDHRIIDGALGGAFLRRVADYIESFDAKSGQLKTN